MTLGEIRKKIDALDAQLLRLLNERADLVHEVGLVKRKEGYAIYAPEREEQLLQGLIKKNQGRLPALAIRAIYREIMSASLALEKDVAIAYLGPEGNAAHQAAREKFGASVHYTARPNIAEVFGAVDRREADYGIVPAEDSPDGAGRHTFDLFMDSNLKICAQVLLPRTDAPARFLVLGHDGCPPTGSDKTSLVVALQDGPGALLAALEPFQKINVSKIESRPGPALRGANDHLFFLDVEGHAQDENLAAALKALEKRASFVKVLGSYPKGA